MTKRALIIVENLPVPFDSRVWKEALALKVNGYEVRVISPRVKGYTRNYELLEGVHIYRHPMPREASRALGYLVEYMAALFWESVYAFWIFVMHGFDVIQGCNPPDTIAFVALLFRPFGVRYIFDHHDVNPELYIAKYGRKDFFYDLLARLESLTFRLSDVVISTNESYRRVAIQRGGVPPENIFVVRNGPDLTRFIPVAPNPALKHGKPFLVGYVGTMGEQEGLDILLEAAAEIKRRGREEVHFTCVGGGPALESLRQMVKSLRLEDTVNFTGRIPDADLIEILSTADVCVNPDIPCEMNDMSTMIKIAEYMAMGKPIVQFDLREGRYTAADASLYCEPTQLASGFADKILWLLDHPDERKRMGEFGKMRVKESLAWEYSVQHLCNAYERALTMS